MTANERTYERTCCFCGSRFITSVPRAVFCSESCQTRELEAIRMLERTTPTERDVA